MLFIYLYSFLEMPPINRSALVRVKMPRHFNVTSRFSLQSFMTNLLGTWKFEIGFFEHGSHPKHHLSLLLAINIPIASVWDLLHPRSPPEGEHPACHRPQKIFTGSDSFSLLAVPFFILAGALMTQRDFASTRQSCPGLGRSFQKWSGMSLSFRRSSLRHLRFYGGGHCGHRFYHDTGNEPSGLHASPGNGHRLRRLWMGFLCLPALRWWFMVALRTSPLSLFAGGFLPALLMPRPHDSTEHSGAPGGVAPSPWPGMKPALKALKESLLALFMPIIIFGGISRYLHSHGSSCLAVAYGLVISMFIYRRLR